MTAETKEPLVPTDATEAQEMDAKEKEAVPPVSFAALFRYATGFEKVLAAVFVLLAMGQGSLIPLQAIFFDQLFMSIMEPDAEVRAEKVRNAVLIFIGLGAGSFLLTSLCYVGLSNLSDRMSARLRTRFFQHLLVKEVGWYDTHSTAEMATRLTQDTYDFREGCGAKLGMFVASLVTIPVGFTVAFIKSWKITLILFGCAPFLGAAMGNMMRVMQKATSTQQESYAKAGGVAETAISGIRTVQAFCGFDRELAKYDERLAVAEAEGVKGGLTIGCSLGFFMVLIYLMFAAGFFIGASFVVHDWNSGCWLNEPGPPFGDCMSGGTVFGAIMGIMLGASGFGQLGTTVAALSGAKSAAGRIYAIVDEPPQFALDSGEEMAQVRGEVELRDVTFFYPTRQEQPALAAASLRILAGQTAAFVGPSGSGKSTIIALLQRFYDPSSGMVCIDGRDIRELNLKWLRSQMGLVQQEPVLFSGTVAENIRYGHEGVASEEQVVKAAKLANAHNFIMDKADGYKTEVGERGSTLSGGQKQRIAIARAMVRDPKILLFDEATSALDNESEKIVQAALDDLLASHPRTTLVVAHRLSTIERAHVINVLENGALKESGTHKELLANKGLYSELYELSKRNTDGESDLRVLTRQLSKNSSQNSRGAPSKSESTPQQAQSGDMAAEQNQENEAEEDVAKADNNETEEADDKEKLPEEDEKDVKNMDGRLFAMQISMSKCWMLVGSLGAAAYAIASPTLGYFFSDSMNIIMVPPASYVDGQWVQVYVAHDVRRDARDTFIKFACIAVGLGVAMCLMQFAFRKSSEALTRRIRRDTFEAMLRQETAFFDERTSGALSNRLAQDPPQLKALTGESLVGLFSMVLTLAAALVLAFSKSVLLTGTVLLIMPFMGVGQALFHKVIQQTNETAAGPLVSEAMGNVKTVASYSLQDKMMNKYAELLNKECKKERRTSTVGGLMAAYQNSMSFFLYSILILFANVYITHCHMKQDSVFGTMFPLLFSMGALQMGSAFFMDRSKAQDALKHIFNTLDRVSKINGMSTEGESPAEVRGEIAFRAVKFAYPTRPDFVVFKNFNLTIAPGKQFAFVGHSGSGKSTSVCLVQRFYDPVSGTVLLDGRDIRSLNIQWLRRQMGFVQQEPVLFAGSVAENVRYGKAEASDEEVVEACKTAHAHAFVEDLEKKYETEVGERGAQLSGGQKQRIAIARALIRDPKVLLLDEATSALDNESERVVQAALDQLLVAKKRTTLVIAHRLSTIAGADAICFIHEGSIVEKGTYKELMAIPDGHFRKLAERQQAEQQAKAD